MNTSLTLENKKMIIIGAGGHAVSVANVAMTCGYEITNFIDKNKAGQSLFNNPILSSLEDLNNTTNYSFAIAIGDNFIREKVFKEIKSKYPHLIFPKLIHPSAVISVNTSIEEGTIVMPNSVIGPNTILSRFCLINTMSSVDHDCILSEFCSTAPGVVTGGQVKIGKRSAISIGATIKHCVDISDDVIVGAKSYVNQNLPEKIVAYGIPAKIIRPRSVGEPYLK